MLRTHTVSLARTVSLGMAAAAVLSIAAARPAAAQSVITFGPAQQISGDADVSTNGTLVGAYAFGHPGSPTVNGVTFIGVGGGQVADGTGTNGNLYVSTFNQEAPLGAYGSASPPFSTLSSGYQTLLGNGLYHDNPGATDTAFFNLAGLTTGHTYELQFFVNDSRGAFGPGHTETLTGGAGSVVLNYNAGGEGGLGQFVTGAFVADNSGTASLAATGNVSTQVNGFQYRDLGVVTPAPEPSQAAVLGLGLLGVGGLALRARRRSAQL